MSTLADEFARSGGDPIVVNGQQIHLWVEIGPIRVGQLTVRMKANSERPQALCISAVEGSVEVAGQRSQGMAFWSDTAPTEIAVSVLAARSGTATLRLWNAWRGSRQVMHSGVGNVGIMVERGAGSVVLRCSDGWGSASFSDLIVCIDGVEMLEPEP